LARCDLFGVATGLPRQSVSLFLTALCRSENERLSIYRTKNTNNCYKNF
jgi:hypothetical protein